MVGGANLDNQMAALSKPVCSLDILFSVIRVHFLGEPPECPIARDIWRWCVEPYLNLVFSTIRSIHRRYMVLFNLPSIFKLSIPISAIVGICFKRHKSFDENIYVPQKREYEPARSLVTIFEGNDGVWYELKVSTPTFEREDLLQTILGWILLLYIVPKYKI